MNDQNSIAEQIAGLPEGFKEFAEYLRQIYTDECNTEWVEVPTFDLLDSATWSPIEGVLNWSRDDSITEEARWCTSLTIPRSTERDILF